MTSEQVKASKISDTDKSFVDLMSDGLPHAVEAGTSMFAAARRAAKKGTVTVTKLSGRLYGVRLK